MLSQISRVFTPNQIKQPHILSKTITITINYRNMYKKKYTNNKRLFRECAGFRL